MGEARDSTIDSPVIAVDAVAFVDADWVHLRGTPPSLVWRDGTLFFRELSLDCDPDDQPDRAAARALFAVAQAAVSAVVESGAERVEVVGSGFVAGLARRLLGLSLEVESARPQAIVDVTADPGKLAAATRRLEPMGTLLLVGEPSGPLAIDLYPDVHVRGLRLVGVPPLLSLPSPPALAPLEDELGANPPAVVGRGQRLSGATWYRLDG